ncbi:hypothetical protein [Rhizobium sp.]|uniref:hypothetical protein n=1 Tax=Rhizobium sp. TaxID=391 RepID=UPI0028AC0E77
MLLSVDERYLFRCRRLVNLWSGNAREPNFTQIAGLMAYLLASHCQSATKLCQARSCAVLSHQGLSIKAVAAVARTAFQQDHRIADVLQRRPVTAAEVLPPSRHLISTASSFIPERRLTTQSDIHMQGADDDKNILNDDADLRDSATILIPLGESALFLILD